MSDGPGPIPVRTYGSSGPLVVVLHGGPGAPGHMAPVARRLAAKFRVLEPLQRGSGGLPLKVGVHIDDLHAVVAPLREAVVLVGASWGAMLALAYAADHTDGVAGVVLVGCGTFTEEGRSVFEQTVQERLTPALRQHLDRLTTEIDDPDALLRARADLLFPAYTVDPLTADLENVGVDAHAHHETWQDMLRLQHAGVYPAAFGRVDGPVLMLHGDRDPHPGPLVRDSLRACIPQLAYREFAACGHYPWLECAAREPFFAVLESWIESVAQPGVAP